MIWLYLKVMVENFMYVPAFNSLAASFLTFEGDVGHKTNINSITGCEVRHLRIIQVCDDATLKNHCGGDSHRLKSMVSRLIIDTMHCDS